MGSDAGQVQRSAPHATGRLATGSGWAFLGVSHQTPEAASTEQDASHPSTVENLCNAPLRAARHGTPVSVRASSTSLANGPPSPIAIDPHRLNTIRFMHRGARGSRSARAQAYHACPTHPSQCQNSSEESFCGLVRQSTPCRISPRVSWPIESADHARRSSNLSRYSQSGRMSCDNV